MTYLIVEILIFLGLAALIGFIAAWLIRGGRAADSAVAEGNASWTHRMTVAEAEFEAKALAAEAANARLQADLHAAENRAALAQTESGKRSSQIEGTLKTQVLTAEALAAERGHQLDQMRNTFNTASNEWRARISMADRDIARLTSALEAAETASQNFGAVSAERDELARRVRELEVALTEATPASTDSAPSPDLSAFQARIAELEAALAAQPAAAPRKAARPAPPPGEDDLQTISGIGPVLEKALKSQGIVTYRALAQITPEQAADLGARMKNNFADRLVRDRWQDQARAQHRARYGEEI